MTRLPILKPRTLEKALYTTLPHHNLTPEQFLDELKNL